MQGNFFGLFRRTSFCRRISYETDELYQTVEIRNIFAFWVRNFGSDREGECGDVCEDLCSHKPCFQDYESLDETLCECFDVKTTACGNNTKCNQVTDNCECAPGYEGRNPLLGCTDTNECAAAVNPCGQGLCVNKDGSYDCTCNPGYDFRNGTCVDRNECASGTPCGPNANCTNSIGSFTCACQRGYRGQPPTTLCSDIDECAERTPCGPNGVCQNTAGNYQCQCNPGFNDTSSIFGGCIDRDECAESRTTCNPTTENCLNNPGGFSCTCKSEYTGTPPNCVDVNECTVTPTICGPDSSCNNTIGSYGCKCNLGFFSTPPNCRKLDSFEKCASGTDCKPGLQCAATSRSDNSTSCCATVDRCNVNQDCCVGAYTAGQACPSTVAADCRDGLKCEKRSATDSTFICCRNVLTLPILGTFCL